MGIFISIDYMLQTAAIIGGLSGQELINRRNRTGFYAWIVSNAAMIAMMLQAGKYGLVGLHLTYTAMCVRGLLRWRAASETVN